MVHPEGMSLDTILLAAASLLALLAAIGAWRPRREGETLARRVEELAAPP